MGSRIQLQQRNCSRISREFLAPVHTATNKELLAEVAARASPLKIYFRRLLAQGAAISKSPTDGGCKPPLLEAQGLRLSAHDLFI
jgi:hypothetical protein